MAKHKLSTHDFEQIAFNMFSDVLHNSFEGETNIRGARFFGKVYSFFHQAYPSECIPDEMCHVLKGLEDKYNNVFVEMFGWRGGKTTTPKNVLNIWVTVTRKAIW